MFTTLQAAFGTWPSDSSHRKAGEKGLFAPSGLNERISFGEDGDDVPSAASVFVVTPENYPGERTRVPPYFVPPGGLPVHERHGNTFDGLQAPMIAQAAPDASRSVQHLSTDMDLDGSAAHALSLRRLAPKAADLHFDHPGPNLVPPQYPAWPGQENPRPSASPPLHELNIEHERAANWSDADQRAFHAMIHAPGYINRYRLSPEKHHRLIMYLRNPEVEPLCENGSKDHQTKYQAAHWVLKEGKLHRKSDGKGTKGLRTHLDLGETWEILTAEHLRTGHLGRDRLRRVLEKKFIGYTLQEIMFILRTCRRCTGVEKSRLHEQTGATMQTEEIGSVPNNEPIEATTRRPAQTQQTSNFMWF